MESRKAASEEMRLQTRRLRKTGSEGADVTCGGRPFQIRAAATGKAHSPTVDNRVRRTTSDDDEADHRRSLDTSQECDDVHDVCIEPIMN